MHALVMILELLLALPWWGVLLVAAGVVFAIAASGLWLSWKVRAITHEALSEISSPLRDAEVTVHAIEPTDRPVTVSQFDVDDDDIGDDDDDDGEWNKASRDYVEPWQSEGDFYWLDVTITPCNAAAAWHASILTLVPVDWVGKSGEICETIGPLHSVELAGPDGFRNLTDGEDELTGTQRVRLLMAAPPDHSRVKFAYFGVTFGNLKLPAPLAHAT